MKITSLKFYDKEEDWGIEPIHFKDLTLLVGASGVGKTRILNAIRQIKAIANGKSLNGVEWNIEFSIGEDRFCWEGGFERKDYSSFIILTSDKKDDSEKDKAVLVYEKVIVNDYTIIERKGTSLIFKEEKSPIPIKAEQSVLTLIPDPLIKKAESEFKKIIFSDYTDSAQGSANFRLIDNQVLSKYETIDDLRNSGESSIDKLFWVYKKSKKSKKLFDSIKQDFTDVFPQVENIKVEPLDSVKLQGDVPFFIKLAPFIQFKEIENPNWIPIMEMSAGMYRTLIHIIELYLSADGTVILIDEFENSLGVNCIDELTNAIKGAIHRIQFIITSHHPYIINNISPSNWKIVTRKGKNIVAQDALELNFNKSKHEAFIQLINLPSYQTGLQG